MAFNREEEEQSSSSRRGRRGRVRQSETE